MDPDAIMMNLTNDSSIPSQYSTKGPQDTPTNNTPPPTMPQRQHRVKGVLYEVPIQSQSPQRMEEERGADYEVPIPSAAGKRYAVIPMKKKPMSQASYNVLKHN